uniref:Uncharacterized protein n=1 Tax=Anguilla anguilla TaxID=7936 RepID=A0A0E9PA88_ANGAN
MAPLLYHTCIFLEILEKLSPELPTRFS